MRSLFLVGAAKSATTAVWDWLSHHSEVATHPIKEPNYFALSGKRNVYHGAELDVNYASRFALTAEDYEAWRETADSTPFSRYICDASPSYLYFPGTAAKIHSAYPDAKIICILRNPVDRAFSQFMHHVRDGYETAKTFGEALAAEEIRIANDWWWGFHYRRAGFYAAQWREYVEVFPPTSLLCLTHDEVEARPEQAWRKIRVFLDIGRGGDVALDARVNESSDVAAVPALGLVNTWIRHPSRLRQFAKRFVPADTRDAIKSRMVSVNARRAPTLWEPLRRELQVGYLSDIQETEALTGLDLSAWRRVCDRQEGAT